MPRRTTLALLAALLVPALAAAQANGATKPARVAIQQQLPAMDGAHLEVTSVEVAYAPGASSAPHSHPCPVIGYVVEGAIRFQVKGDSLRVLTAGQTFYEPPNGVHVVSGNASDTAPAKLLATFVCDAKKPLSTPAK